MCGIAGIWGLSGGQDVLRESCEKMTAAIAHRRPDSSGLWLQPEIGLALGHRRLAIQDLSVQGDQPMESRSGRYQIVFNGEIYNFRDIAADLAALGISFRGHSDTEVLLAAIEAWGIEAAVKRSVGMFAFAVWDKKLSELHLYRDRLGEKPLYYGWIDGILYFSSELKGIEAVIQSHKLTIDSRALATYLRYGYIGAPASIYQEIRKLKPGYRLTVTGSPREDTVSECYWSLEAVAAQGRENRIHDQNEACSNFQDLLSATIRRQLVADVDVGLFLSGGIDSSLVTALAQEESGKRIQTYTIGFDERDYNEAGYAEKIARHIGTEHRTLSVTSRDALDIVPDIASVYDEPFADSSQIPTYLVSRLARQHVTVCLSGDGGDELFAGYNRYLWADKIWQRMNLLPGGLRKFLGTLLAGPSTEFWNKGYGLLGKASRDKNSIRLVGLKMQKLAGFLQQEDMFGAYRYLLSYWQNPEQLIKTSDGAVYPVASSASQGSENFIESAMLMDQNDYLPGDNLVKVDRASMAVALETRLPLLSHELVEFSWRIPLDMKVRGQQTKWLMRELLYRYVPRELIDRPKMGFSVPIAEWLRSELRDWSGDTLMMLDNVVGDFIDTKLVQTAWQEHQSGRTDHSHRLWTMLMMTEWLHRRRDSGYQ